MNEENPELAPPQETKRTGWPSGRQALILFSSGLVLGIGGCAAFLSVVMNDSSGLLSFLFGSVFFVGLILVLVAFVECIVIIIRGLSGKA